MPFLRASRVRLSPISREEARMPVDAVLRRSSGSSSLRARLVESEPHLRAAVDDAPVIGELVDDP